jgi:hypothetical protein
MAVALGSVIAPARHAAAFTMGEQMATTGVANTLGATSAPSAASTIGSVKNKLSTSGASSVPKLSDVKQPTGLGAGSPTHKRTAKGKSGWGNSKNWAKNGKGGKGGAGWNNSGGWPKSDGWSGKGGGKVWAKSGGGSWARPGNKS